MVILFLVHVFFKHKAPEMTIHVIKLANSVDPDKVAHKLTHLDLHFPRFFEFSIQCSLDQKI